MNILNLNDRVMLQLNMLLASIAYGTSRAKIEADLKKVTLLSAKGFELSWFGTGAGTQMYVCNPVGSPANFVAIRGSVTDPSTEAFWVDWLDLDIRVFHQVAWPFPNDGVPSNAKIAAGTSSALLELKNMRDSKTNLSLLSYLSTLMPNMLMVNGHSLGGELATGMSLHLQKQTAHMVLPYTFAAPSIGNQPFAQYMNNLFAGMYFARTYNTLDNIPKFWGLDGIKEVQASYSPKPKIPILIDGLIILVKEALWLFDYPYEHVHLGSGQALQGTLQVGDSWLKEVGHQHSHLTYLKLLGYS
jgi:hypothetical protein